MAKDPEQKTARIRTFKNGGKVKKGGKKKTK